MAFKKGKTKTGGKVKGTPNKLAQSARELFVTTLEGQVQFIQEAFNEVRQEDKAKYLELFAKYAQYFVPKQLDIGLSSNDISVTIVKKK